MLVIAGNLRLGAHKTRRAYLGSTPVFAAEQTRWGTDFGEYSTGSAPGDWTSYPSASLVTFEIASGGLVSNKRMRIRDTASSGFRMSLFVWDVLPEVVDSEVLLLVERGGANNLNNLHGVAQRLTVTSSTNNSGLLLGVRNNASDITRRRIHNGLLEDQENVVHGGSYEAGKALWMRCRWDGANYRVKGWEADTGEADLGLSDEPSAWQLDGTFATITGAGKTGVLYHMFGATADRSETFVHYFGVGIDGDSAPLPVFAPGPAPVPDRSLFETFDSTATSFDSTAHTFDEVV